MNAVDRLKATVKFWKTVTVHCGKNSVDNDTAVIGVVEERAPTAAALAGCWAKVIGETSSEGFLIYYFIRS